MVEETGVRARILNTALRLFVAQGYNGVSMREIAALCELSKAGLYYHFEDKEDLFLEILKTGLNHLETITHQAASQQGGVRQKIAFFVRALFTDLPAGQRDVIRLANQDIGKISSEQRDAFTRQYDEKFVHPLQVILQEGVDRGEMKLIPPPLAVWALLGLLYPFLTPGGLLTELENERVVEFILTVFFEGVSVARE